MDVCGFLASRHPGPPAALEAWIGSLSLEGPAEGALLRGGLAELRRARSRPGRVRESALSLLAADALLTWACEAALEAGDPEASMAVVLKRAGAPEP